MTSPSHDTDTLAPPLVHTRGDRRTLEFRPGMIQSAMRLSQPDEPVLRYVRAMLCFTLFQPRPAHIVMVGLGGGSLLKFCYRYLPHSRITVIESRADVIALREQFMIPPDDARLRVIHADATAYISQLHDCADVLLVDGFDLDGLPPALGTTRFYTDCRRALRSDGLLVANIFSYDPHYPRMLGRLFRVFGGAVCWFDGIAGNNRILFAVKAGAPTPTAGDTRRTSDAAPPASAAAGQRALHTLRLVRWRRRFGLAFLNRWLPGLVVRRLSRRTH